MGRISNLFVCLFHSAYSYINHIFIFIYYCGSEIYRLHPSTKTNCHSIGAGTRGRAVEECQTAMMDFCMVYQKFTFHLHERIKSNICCVYLYIYVYCMLHWPVGLPYSICNGCLRYALYLNTCTYISCYTIYHTKGVLCESEKICVYLTVHIPFAIDCCWRCVIVATHAAHPSARFFFLLFRVRVPLLSSPITGAACCSSYTKMRSIIIIIKIHTRHTGTTNTDTHTHIVWRVPTCHHPCRIRSFRKSFYSIKSHKIGRLAAILTAT